MQNIGRGKAICSECTNFCLKRKNNTHKTFHILKMKAHFEKEPHFGNEMRLNVPDHEDDEIKE